MVVCPHCHKHRLGLWSRMGMSNSSPSLCPACGGLYVNRSFNTVMGIISMLTSVTAVVAVSAYLPVQEELTIVLGGLTAWVAYGACARPMRFEDLRMYTKRAWWEYPLIYVVLPLGVVLLGLLLLFKYHGAI